MFKVIALLACWSHDYWLDIRHDDPEIREEDQGPSSYEFALLSTSTDCPGAERIQELVAATRAALPTAMDGHGELHSYAVLDQAAWMRLVDQAPASLRLTAEANRRDHPIADHERDATWLNLCGLELDEPLRMSAATGAAIQPAERHGLPGTAPALTRL